MSQTAMVFAFNSDDLNRRLRNCTPTKDFNAGNSTFYQISGLYGSVCKYKIEYGEFSNKPDLICSVPMDKMGDMTSYNPIVVQKLKSQYCRMSLKNLNRYKKGY